MIGGLGSTTIHPGAWRGREGFLEMKMSGYVSLCLRVVGGGGVGGEPGAGVSSDTVSLMAVQRQTGEIQEVFVSLRPWTLSGTVHT